jgi:hypothetical protein
MKLEFVWVTNRFGKKLFNVCTKLGEPVVGTVEWCSGSKEYCFVSDEKEARISADELKQIAVFLEKETRGSSKRAKNRKS